MDAESFSNGVHIPLSSNFPNITMLRSANRVFIGDRYATYPPGDVEKTHLYRAGAQQWFGRFYLPNSVVALKKEEDLLEAYRDKKKFFIEKGYLIVNFDINVYRGGNEYSERSPRLSYKNSTSNTWENEGYQNRFRDDEIDDFQLKYGDVIVFDLSRRAMDRLKIGR